MVDEAACVVLVNGKKALDAFSFAPGEPVAAVDARLTALLSLPRTHRLLLRGKELSDPSASFAADAGSTLYVLSTSEETVADVRAAVPDPLLRGFAARRSPYAARPVSTASMARANSPYGFKSVQPLPGKPNEAEARRLLWSLANDVGFSRVMESRRWSVGCLAEMEAEGKVGVDPVCVLGYNTNAGQSIHLRLRTDDGNGFRPVYKLREVLAHELAHNVHSEHDRQFYDLMNQVEREASHGSGRTTGGSAGPREGGDPLADEESGPSLSIVERLGSGPPRPPLPAGDAAARGPPRPAPAEGGPAVNVDAEDSAPPVADPVPPVGPGQQGPTPTGESVAPPPPPPSPPPPAPPDELVMLVSMGFSRALATAAMRECNGRATGAADWLLCLSGDDGGGGVASASTPDASALTERLEAAITALSREVGAGNQEALDDALLALHLYVFNLVSRPGEARYRQINGRNAAFQRRVGRYPAGADVLRAVGFTPQDSGRWLLEGPVDVARVWLAKSVLVRALHRGPRPPA
jgi:WLM domain/PUB domain